MSSVSKLAPRFYLYVFHENHQQTNSGAFGYKKEKK